MARPRTFDETTALAAAAATFRRHGYADTTTEQLCAAAGVGRGSLYNAFTSKEELFIRALEQHLRVTSERQRELLEDSGEPGFRRIEQVVGLTVEEEAAAVRGGHAAGCLIVGTLMAPDLRHRDERITRSLEADRKRRHAAVEHAVRVGQADGSIVRNETPADLAWVIAGLVAGLRVNAQAGAPVAVLRRTAAVGLRALRP